MRRALVTLGLLVSFGCGGADAPDEAQPSAAVEKRDAPSPTAEPTASGEAAEKTLRPRATPFDPEAWRKQTIKLFGPEREFSDGSKEDYVKMARQLCGTKDRPDYEKGTLQDHIEKTFCPYDDPD